MSLNKDLQALLFTSTSTLRSYSQYYNTAYNDAQRNTLIKESMNATANAIDEVAQIQCMQNQTICNELDELRTRIERLESMVAAMPGTKACPAPVFADIELSKDSLKQIRNDIIKSIQF